MLFSFFFLLHFYQTLASTKQTLQHPSATLVSYPRERVIRSFVCSFVCIVQRQQGRRPQEHWTRANTFTLSQRCGENGRKSEPHRIVCSPLVVHFVLYIESESDASNASNEIQRNRFAKTSYGKFILLTVRTHGRTR